MEVGIGTLRFIFFVFLFVVSIFSTCLFFSSLFNWANIYFSRAETYNCSSCACLLWQSVFSIKQKIGSHTRTHIQFFRGHHYCAVTQDGLTKPALFSFWIQWPSGFQAQEQRETCKGSTVMTNHEPATQSSLLHREPLMQVNHILNILISRSWGWEGGSIDERGGWVKRGGGGEICSAR